MWGFTPCRSTENVTYMVACMALDNYFTYDFFLYFFSFFFWTHNRSTKSLLLSQKPSKTGSVNSIFSNIEIKKNFQKLALRKK